MPTVVGLMVEPVRQRRRQLLLEFFRRRDAAVFDRPSDAAIIKPVDKIDNPPVLRRARGAEVVETLEQDRVQPVRRVALAGKPLHPDPVGREQMMMIEGAMDRSEKGAAIGAI